jgi:hypothetical protein
MFYRGKVARIVAGVAAVSLSVSTAAAPTGLAGASHAPVASPATSIDPLVAVSLFASSTSRAALCGAAGTTAAATTASATAAATTAQPVPGAGCVLPMGDSTTIAGAPGAGVPVAVGAAPLAFGGISGPLALTLALAGVAGIVAAAGGFRGDGINGRPRLSGI